MRYLLAFLMLTFFSYGFNYHMKPTKVEEGVSCFFGLYGKADETNGGRVVNSCYVETDEGYIVIDSGPTYSYAQQAYSAMQELNRLPVKYVINTSSDETKVLGNEFYQEQGARLVGPQSYEELLNNEKELSLLSKLPKSITINTRIVPLDIYQNNATNLTLGDTPFTIKSFEKDHSNHLVVHFPTKKTLFAGDYINNGKEPNWIKHDTNVWEKALKSIKETSSNYLISSHGTKFKSTQSVLQQTEQHLAALMPKPKTLHKETRLAKVSKANATKESSTKEEKTKKVTETQKIAKVEKTKSQEIKKKATDETIQLAKSMVNSHEKALKETKAKSCPAQINYQPSYDIAERQAKLEHKYLLVKIESNGCKPCEELNKVLATNCNIKEIINKHTKAAKINATYQDVPQNLNHMGTPALFLVEPENNKIVLHLEGRIDPQDLEESLKLFTNTDLAMAQ